MDSRLRTARTSLKVSPAETEETFFNRPILVVPDDDHSQREQRYAGLGKTNAG